MNSKYPTRCKDAQVARPCWEVLDWTVCHSDPPAVWLITLRAWYRLGVPHEKYLQKFATIQRRLAFCQVAARELRLDWELSVEDGLDAMREVAVVPGDLADLRFRGGGGVAAAAEVAAAKLKAAAEARFAGGNHAAVAAGRCRLTPG